MSGLSETFDRIYRESLWDDQHGSGPGSVPDANYPYVAYIKQLISQNPGVQFIDWGCGDGRIARAVLCTLKNTSYTLYDVSPMALDKARIQLSDIRSSHNLQFLTDEPRVDENCIVLAKDVLIHLSRYDIRRLLNLISKARIAVFNQDNPPSAGRSPDILTGGYRPVSLYAEGSLPETTFLYWCHHAYKRVETFKPSAIVFPE